MSYDVLSIIDFALFRAQQRSLSARQRPYELVLENILDLTHIAFVHGSYAGTSESKGDNIRFESTSETVTMIRTIRGRPTAAYQRDVLGLHYRARHKTLMERQKRGDFSYLPDIAQGSDVAEILKIKRLR